MQRKAFASWKGGLRTGNGMVSTDSRVLWDAAYSFGTRFENTPGTNPEELVAAAHAACFSMALSFELERHRAKPTEIHTDAVVTLEKLPDGWRVTAVQLDVVGEVQNMSDDAFEDAANVAKKNCPISRLLNANITLNARLRQIAA